MDPTVIIMVVVLAALVFVMFRNSRKRKAAQENLKTQMVPGAEVMTNFGLYGTLLSNDPVSNIAEIEVSPGTVLRVHSQALAKVVDSSTLAPTGGAPRSVEEAMAIANAEAEAREAEINAKEPEFGERVDDDSAKNTSSKKTAE